MRNIPDMNKKTFPLILLASLAFSSCSVKLASLVDKTNEQIATAYKVTKDVPYGDDKEQTMDIYTSGDVKKLVQ